MAGLGDRSTGDLLVLMIAGTVCLAVIGFGILVGVLAVSDPSLDLRGAFGAIAGIINTLLGLMAGYLAARSRRNGDRP